MQRGAFDDEITAAVRELVVEMTQAVEKGTSKPKAKLTITVDLTLDRGMMDLTADFAVKHPKKVRGRTVMYPARAARSSRTIRSSSPSRCPARARYRGRRHRSVRVVG